MHSIRLLRTEGKGRPTRNISTTSSSERTVDRQRDHLRAEERQATPSLNRDRMQERRNAMEEQNRLSSKPKKGISREDKWRERRIKTGLFTEHEKRRI